MPYETQELRLKKLIDECRAEQKAQEELFAKEKPLFLSVRSIALDTNPNLRLTPLMYAIKKGRRDKLVELLIDSGEGYPYAIADGLARAGDERVALHGETYEVSDGVLRALDELEEHPDFYRRREIDLAGEPPAWMTDGGGFCEQLVHAELGPPWSRDFVLRAVWAFSEGAHACSIRPAASEVAPELAGRQRSAVSADVWVLANPEEPGNAVLHAVVDPGDSAPLVSEGAGAKQLLEWTRRVQEAAIVLQRDSIGVAR